MAVNSVRFVFVVACLLASCTQAHEPSTDPRAAPLVVEQNISQTCFGCICEAASGCDTTSVCSGNVCGPFRITWGYWLDAGKPSLNGEPSYIAGAYQRCANDISCASRAVQGYMNRYAVDCNHDGVINCDDYVRIHRHGSSGCAAPLDPQYEDAYRVCMQTFGK